MLLPIGLAATVLFAGPSSGATTQFPPPLPGLPDLISDRPYIWREQQVVHPENGSMRRVLAFDGFLHNVGEGSLDLLGNPQIPNDVVQRVFDGDTWKPVASDTSPTVRYETDDGHSHFHIIGISEYFLYDRSRRYEVDESSKIGFCLVDTEQVEEITDAFYEINRFQYCNQDDPDSTELRMGISPGWRDTYDANTTLQWVDVSNVQPGHYWIAALTDPNNEIVESNEDNNGLVYSRNTFPVAGYLPHVSPDHVIDGPATAIELDTHAIGMVGSPSWMVTVGPENGTLDVPIGLTLPSSVVRYTPNDGFTGTDSFEWQVRDSSRIFPNEVESATAQLTIPAAIDAETKAETSDATAEQPPETLAALQVEATEYSYIATPPPPTTVGSEVQWFSHDLPAGLEIDPTTGAVDGVPTSRGTYKSTLVAWNGAIVAVQPVSWTITKEDTDLGVRAMHNVNSAVGERVDIFLGASKPGAAYEATGVPDGAESVTNIPWVAGTPREVGIYEITVSEIIDGETSSSTSFTWTVRPAPIPAFPL